MTKHKLRDIYSVQENYIDTKLKKKLLLIILKRSVFIGSVQVEITSHKEQFVFCNYYWSIGECHTPSIGNSGIYILEHLKSFSKLLIDSECSLCARIFFD